MRPTQALLKRTKTRVQFTTKQVANGFYRGTGTGSTGAHTPDGGYLTDWRKVRHFVVPNLKGFKLTPYVSKAILAREEIPTGPDLETYRVPIDGMTYLRWLKEVNAREFEWQVEREQQQQDGEAAR